MLNRKTDNQNISLDIEEMVGQEAMRVGSAPDPMSPEGEGVQVASAFGNFVDFAKKSASKVDRMVGRATGGVTDPRTQQALANVRQRQEGDLDPTTQDAVSEVLEPTTAPPPGDGDQASEALEAPIDSGMDAVDIDAEGVQSRFEADGPPDEKRTGKRNLNTERHMQGAAASVGSSMEQAQTADDVAAIFDAVAEEIGEEHVVRHNVTLEEMTPDDIRNELKPFLSKDKKERGLMTDRQLYATRSVLNTMGTEVSGLANQIKAGNATSEMLLTYQKKVRALAGVQSFLRGNVREVARALQQQSVIAKTLRGGSLGDIDELMNVANMTPQQIERHAQVVASNVETHGAIAGLKPTFFQRINDKIALAAEYWKANILSGPETHIVNIGGNGAYNVWENIVIRPTAAVIGKGLQHTRFGSDTDRVHVGETMGAVVSGYAGLRDGLTVMAQTLLKDKSLFMTQGKGESQGLMAQAANAVQGPVTGKIARGAATTLSMPFRFLQAEDDLFKTIAYRQELTARSLRQAYAEGLDGSAAYKRSGELIAEPPSDIHEASLLYAKNLTYTNTESPGLLGLAGANMKKMTAAYPILQLITPFINTPVNLMQRSIDMSVLSVASPTLLKEVTAGGAARDVALAKMATGSALTAMAYHYFTNGMITGNGPDNYKQRAVLEKTGWRPNSIKDGDGKYHPYKRLDPFAASIAGLVDKLEAAQYANEEQDASVYMSAAVFGIAEHMMDGTFLRGVGDLFKLMDGKLSASSYFANMATGLDPMIGLQRGVSKLTDPQPRRTSDDKEFQTGFISKLTQGIKKATPGLSMSLRPKRHWDGAIATPGQGRVGYAMSPVKTSEDKGATAVDAELIKNGVPIAEPAPMVTVGSGPEAIHFSLVDLDNGDGLVYDKYFQRVGDRRKEFLQQLVKDDDYLSLSPGPGGERHLEMKKMIHRARVAGLEDFLENDLLPMYRKKPEDFNSIALQVGLGMDDFHERIINMLLAKDAVGELRPEKEEMLTHVRKGTGKRETALPMPTDKVKPEKPFEVGF